MLAAFCHHWSPPLLGIEFFRDHLITPPRVLGSALMAYPWVEPWNRRVKCKVERWRYKESTGGWGRCVGLVLELASLKVQIALQVSTFMPSSRAWTESFALDWSLEEKSIWEHTRFRTAPFLSQLCWLWLSRQAMGILWPSVSYT